MIRETIFSTHEHEHHHGFRNRGHEVKRIETLSDAVFAFAVTLLIVSLEVPKTFEELVVSMKGFAAFAICFTLLMLVWHQQHVFFRRYAMDDTITILLNSMLLFIVLFYVYPLKFLFSLLFSDNIYPPGKNPFSIKDEQFPQLMAIYGLGYVIIYSIFLLLYRHALRKRGHLQLSPIEVFDTRTKIIEQLTMIAIGVCSVILALLLAPKYIVVSGLVYMTIGPALSLFYWRRAAQRRKIEGR